MNNLFSENINPVQDLIQSKHQARSHTFSKGVIAAYYSVFDKKNNLTVTDDYILINQRRRDVLFLLNKDVRIDKLKDSKVIYCEEKTEYTPKKLKEFQYDLVKLFNNPDKQIRRGMNLLGRPEIEFIDIGKDERVNFIFNEWNNAKINNPKVFRIAFNPARYLRSYALKEKGFDIYQKLITVKKNPYAIINFSIEEEYAFELSFCSLFFNKELKIINDLNECILIQVFYQLYQQGIRYVNPGQAAGIKGLAFFKKKIPYEEIILYKN